MFRRPRAYAMGIATKTRQEKTFTLNDEAGSLPVKVLGSCSPNALDVLPKDGETVRLTGTVHVLKTEYPCHMIVQAATIQILDSSDQP